MKYLNVHGKQLPIPSFFQVYNYGGGNADKDREIVYSEFTADTPALINYFYINNRYKHLFQSHYFDDLSGYKKIGDVYNYIRKQLITERKEIYSGYKSDDTYDFNKKVFLLDSGAANIVKYIAKEVNYDVSKFHAEIVRHMKDYYDFADRLHIDLVVGFDLGGKYTEKDGEKYDAKLCNFFASIDPEAINNMLLEETIKYLSSKTEYYPYVLATVHGALPSDYDACMDYILNLESMYSYKFWGFALGGIASYKQVDSSWYGDIDFGKRKRGFIETVTPARACRIAGKKAGGRPIHALGCGGYPNIAMNYYCGATSFDAASPVRRVGDGSAESTEKVYIPTPLPKVSFSKYFVGGINEDNTLRTEPCSYVKLNEVKDTMSLCGCLACQSAGSVRNIKDLYHMKSTGDDEACYYSRQLMGLHAVRQHRKLCEIISGYPDMNSFAAAYPSELNKGLAEIYKQL